MPSHAVSWRQDEQIRRNPSVLSGRRGAGRRIVEEKLFMERGKKWLNVTRRQKRRMQQENASLWSGAEVGGLANLTSGFVLPFCVGVRRNLRNKYNKNYG